MNFSICVVKRITLSFGLPILLLLNLHQFIADDHFPHPSPKTDSSFAASLALSLPRSLSAFLCVQLSNTQHAVAGFELCFSYTLVLLLSSFLFSFYKYLLSGSAGVLALLKKRCRASLVTDGNFFSSSSSSSFYHRSSLSSIFRNVLPPFSLPLHAFATHLLLNLGACLLRWRGTLGWLRVNLVTY